MARALSPYPALYKAKIKAIYRYARRLEKRGYEIDYRGFPKPLQHPNIRSWKKIESFTNEDVRLRATKVVNGRKLSYKEAEHESRSQASKKGWATRRREKFEKWREDVEAHWQEEPPDKFIDWVNDDSIGPDYEDIWLSQLSPEPTPEPTPLDKPYYPDEGLISMGNAAKILGAPDDFIEECLDRIDNCFYDPLFGERNIKWVRESTTYGELLTNYLRQIWSDEEKTKKAVENVVKAGADDNIFRLIDLMMFADSDSPDPPHVTFQNITRIFEGRSYSIPSASEVEEWEDGFD